MSILITDVEVHNGGPTSSNETRVCGPLSFLDDTTLLCRCEVMVLRLSDGATKAWTFDSLVRRWATADVQVCETIPPLLNVFATAADGIALAGATISLFSDATQVGINCQGILDTPLEWSVKILGRMITVVPE